MKPEPISLKLVLQVAIDIRAIDHGVLVPSLCRDRRIRLEPLIQAGISVNTWQVRIFSPLRYIRDVVLAHYLPMHIHTWQVHLIALDWDHKLAINQV